MRELEEGGFEKEESLELQEELKEICKMNFDAFIKEAEKESDSNEKISISVSKSGEYFTFVNKDFEKNILRIKEDSLKGLYDMYKEKNSSKEYFHDENFLRCLYLLLFRYFPFYSLTCRYDTTDGDASGNQMALPQGVFNYLQSEYGLECECFASPLNRYAKIQNYCSQFIDTDKPFGSLGSFFEYWPEEGAFECNPPFVEECMIQNIKHVLECLKKAEEAKKSLTFFIIVPAWRDDCESYRLTTENDYFVLEIEMKKDDYFYRNGMAHQKDYTVMDVHSDSLLLVLQTSEAKEKNKIDSEKFEREIRSKWGKESEEYLEGKRESNRGRLDRRISDKRRYHGYKPRDGSNKQQERDGGDHDHDRKRSRPEGNHTEYEHKRSEQSGDHHSKSFYKERHSH